MKRPCALLLMLSLACVGGCTLAPKYVRPNATVPSGWPEGPIYPDSLTLSDLPSAPELAPEEFFQDRNMRAILDLALDNNLDLQLAALNVEKVRAYYKIQRVDLYPSLNAVGWGTRHRIPADLSSTGEAMTAEEYGINVGISSWEIDLFGRVRSEKNQAREQYLASEAGLRGARLSLVAAVGQSYLALAATREQLQLAQSTLISQQSFYDIIQKRYDIGLTTKLDLRRAQTQVEYARRDVSALSQLAAQDRNALVLLVGTEVPDVWLPDVLSGVSPPRSIEPGLSSDVLLGRPDIMAAEHRLRAANAYLGVARASFFPRISLTALLGTASAALSGLFDADSDSWTFSPQMVMPIFDLRTHAALKASEADQQIILTQYQSAIHIAFREVADALAAKGTIDQQVVSQMSIVEATEEAFSIAQMRYDEGIDSYLSVLDAQRSLYGAQQSLVGIQMLKLVNQIRLYAVLGGGGCVAD